MKLIVAAGGTGGHLFPATAVVQQLGKICDLETIFIGNPNKIEATVVPGLGYKFVPINISGLNKLVSANTIKLPFQIYNSVRKIRKIIRDFKPDAALCTGAYISYPLGLAAAKERIPLILMESNVYPGKTLKMLAKKANTIFTSFDDSQKYFTGISAEKIINYGNPVRDSIINLPDGEKACSFWGFDSTKPVVLVFGGSLGARSINSAVENSIENLAELGIQFLWQTGKTYTPSIKSTKSIKILPFINEMEMAYAASDLVVARSGATTLSELCVSGKPSILVPYPLAANDHQTHNAAFMEKTGCSIFITDNELEASLYKNILELLDDHDKLKSMSENAKKIANPDSAKIIAEFIRNLK